MLELILAFIVGYFVGTTFGSKTNDAQKST